MPNEQEKQVIINISDTIPPQNIATIDKDGAVGNTYTKAQFDDAFSDKSEEINTKIENIQQMVESDFKGTLKPSDASPTEDGSYKPEISSNDSNPSDPDNYGTVYANAGNLRAKEGYETMFYKKGSVWTKAETKMPGVQISSEFDPTNDTDAQAAKQIKDYIYQSTALFSGDDWNISEKERHRKLVLSGNKTINVSINDGDEGFMLVEGNGFILTINGKAISISDNPVLIGIKRLLGSIVIKYSDVEFLSQSIGTPLIFSGSNLTNTNSSWEATIKNGSWGNIGIDSGVLAANTAGRIWFQYQATNGGSVLGFTDGSIAVGFGSMKVGFWKNQSPDSWGKSENGSISEFSTLTPVSGRFYGLLREVSGIVRWQYSDDEVTWTNIVDFTTTFTGSLRAVCDIRGNSGDKMIKPKRNY